MKKAKITIEAREETHVLEARGFLGATVSGKKKDAGNVESMQFFDNSNITDYELFTMVSTILGIVYKVFDDVPEADLFIEGATFAGKELYSKDK